MDDLLREFLTETGESLNVVDAELVRFEQDPNNSKILGNIFRLVHTIKGTCGFLALPRLETLAHAAENVMGKFRDGMPVTAEAVTIILATIDRIKSILDEIEAQQQEPNGTDADLIDTLGRLGRGAVDALPPAVPLPESASEPETEQAEQADLPEKVDLQEKAAPERPEEERSDRLAAHSIRVNVDTLDHLMTTVSEL